jgi:EmrB/QacA subfamily drug resistance transporter
MGANLRGKPWPVTASCCLALVLIMASVTGINLALKGIAVDLHASGSQLTWVADAYTVVLAALVLACGAMGDDFGRRSTLLAGTAIFGVAAAVAATGQSASFLIVCRAVMGLGAALAMPSTLSTITAVFPAERRDQAIGIWAGFASVGALVGLLLSGALLEGFSWRSTFLATAVLAAFSFVATLVLTPNTKAEEEPLPDFVATALTAVGVGALVYAIIEGADRGWRHPLTMGAFALAAVCLTGWVLYDLRIARPILEPRLFLHRGFSAGSAALVIQFLGTFGFFYVGLQYVQLVLGYGPFRSAVAFLPMAAVIMPLSAMAPRLAERIGNRLVMAAGLLCMIAAFLAMTRLRVSSGYPEFLLATLVFSGGLALSATPATTVIVGSLPAGKRGVASAVNDVTRELGSAIGIALLGSLFSSFYRAKVEVGLTGLPQQALDYVKDSPAAGLEIASDPRLGAQGAVLATHIREAFMHGMSQAFLVGAVTVAVGLVYVVLVTPGHDVSEQAGTRS